MRFTTHGLARSRQRRIPAEAIQVLLDFGLERRRGGANVIFLDRAARQMAQKKLGECDFARIERKLNAYVVVSDDGKIITVSHRRKRLKF